MRLDGATIPIEHWHFHRRLLERYGIVLAPGEFSGMVNSLCLGKALPVERRKGDTAIYHVPIKRLYERAYILSDGKRLITVLLPNRGLNKKRRQLRAETLRSAGADNAPAGA